MNLKPKYCFGVVVICAIAVVTFHSGVCEPVGYSSRTSEQGLKNDMQSVQTAAMLKAKRQHLVSRMRLRKSNIHPTFIKSLQHLGQTSTFAMSALGPAQDQYQNNPSNHFKTNCNRGEVKRISQGRFDIAGTGQASTTLLFPSGSLHSDTQTQTEVRGDLQPVVQCTEASMTLRVPRKWAPQLRVGTGDYFSFPLSKLPPQCGYSIHKGWRDISVGVQYNGCHVIQEGAHYVLPLLWLRTPVKISCPVSPLKSQAMLGLSLCCSSFGITIRIQGPSAAMELNVNVRGEWTPLLELVQHCGYSMDRSNAETIIAAPFLACGITSRDGNRELSLQIGEEVFALTCRLSPTEVPQHQSPQPTTSAMAQTPNPRQWAPPFYLAPPHFPHPRHHHKTRVHGNTPLTRTTTSCRGRQLETPQQDEQRNDHIRPPEEYYRKQASRMNWAKVAPPLKRTSSRTRSPTRATGYSPTLLPHNYAFNPYYHFYHHPKIPLTNPDSMVKSHQPGEISEKMPMFYLNLASMPHDPLIHHDLTRTHFDFRNPMRTTQASPLPTFAAQIQTGHTTKTSVSDLAPITPFVNLMRSPTNQHPPYGSPMNPNTPVYTHYRLPHDFYHFYPLYHRAQAENLPTPASVPLSQQTPNSVPPSEDPKDGFGSYFQPELPVQFKPGNDPAEGLNDEGESAAHSDPSYDGSSWEKWLEMAAKVNNVPEPLYMFPLPDEEMKEEASVHDHFSASSMAQLLASPCSSGTGSHFHHTVSPGFFSFPVKECIVGEHFVFSLPEFAVEPKVVSPGDSRVSCALKRLTSNVYFVPLHGCGVTKQVIDALMIYQLELETCNADNSLIRMLVECRLYPGFPPAETLLILDPLPLQYLIPLQLRIATDESFSFHQEAHRPLSGLRGRLVFMELSLLQPPDPSVALRVHYCLAYTLTPYASAMLIYDGCLPGSESQLLPSLSSNTRYIVVTSFLSLTSSNPSIVYDADPEVYFFCLTEVCASSDSVCFTGCMNSSE